MSWSANHQAKSANMERLEREIQREEKKLADEEHDFVFKQQEHENRIEKLRIRQDSQVKNYETEQSRQHATLHKNDDSGIAQAHQKVADLERDLNKLRAEKQKIVHKIEQETKESGETAHDINRNPEMLRLNDQMQRIEQELSQRRGDENRLSRDVRSKEERFDQRQAMEMEKLRRTHEKDYGALEDDWLRTRKYHERRIAELQSKITHLKSDYEAEKRAFSIQQKRMEEMESRRRAQHGNEDRNQNYARATKDNQLGNTSSTRRRR